MGRRIVLLLGAAGLLVATRISAQLPLLPGERPDVIADGRDHYTLLSQRLVNRQIIEQLRADDQRWRIGNRWDNLALAADASIGSQQTGDKQTRFHGFYILDTYSAARPFPGADANLNLTLFNPSASDGYRVSSSVSAQLALHLYFDAELAPGHLVELDVFGTDLGPTSMGAGLLLEQVPLEGVLAGAQYEWIYFRHIFGGRGFWPNDDILIFQLGAFEGLAELTILEWQNASGSSPRYFDAAVDIPILGGPLPAGQTLLPELTVDPTVRIAAEYALRLHERQIRHGGMLRADFLAGIVPGLNLHLGYQFRYYDRGFSPREGLDPPTTTYNLPLREDYYVTNSFEYFGSSSLYRQWSHTGMGELRVPLGPYFSVVAEVEYLRHFARDFEAEPPSVPLPLDATAPRSRRRLYYRTALQLNPWQGFPHRLSVNLTNKQVQSRYDFRTRPVSERFEEGTWVLFLAEAFL